MSTQNSKSTSSGPSTTSASTETTRGTETQPVTIEIRGQRLTIRSDRDPEFVQRLAGYIDSTLQQLHESAPTAPNDKLLLLAGMTVAEELFEMRDQLDEMQQRLDETTETMFDLIDQVEEVGAAEVGKLEDI